MVEERRLKIEITLSLADHADHAGRLRKTEQKKGKPRLTVQRGWPTYLLLRMLFEELTYQIRGAMFSVYNELGPGLLESYYERALYFELKSVEELHPVHKKQLLTYLKLMDKRIGILVNFNVARMENKVNILRVINELSARSA